MAATRADRLRHDDLILRAAARRLSLDPAATLQQIADAAGVSRLTLYRGFADRAALITSLRAAVDADLDAALAQVPGWDDGSDTLGELVRALAGVASRYPIAVLRYSPVPGPPPPADAEITAILRAGQRAGALRRDVAAGDLNAMLFGTLAALLIDDRRTTDDPPVADHPSTADSAVADTVLTLLRSGMSAPEGTSR